jgi:adenylate kinase family enzyme
MPTPPHRALLLLGPTGAGKTPLGDLIEARTLWQTRWAHFDFGVNLRRIAALDQPEETITSNDIEFVRRVLATGVLLEDDQFPLARRILESFLARQAADPVVGIVLNGLPRHAGQASAVEGILHVDTVLNLVCDAETVLERIRSNVGGDRTGRADDDLPAIRRKLAIFDQRTAPLVDHYRCQGARVIRLTVSPTMTPGDAWQALQRLHAGPAAC